MELSKAEVDAELSRLAKRLAADREALADAVMERVSDDLPGWLHDPSLFEMSRVFARESIETELDCLGSGALPETCPPIDAAGARRGARAGTPVDALLMGYRAGHAAQWNAWFRLIEAEVDDDELRRELADRASRFFFDYADRLSRLATREFTEERDQMLRGREHRLVALVRELLDGGEVSAEDLGYDPRAHHIGVAAVGPDSGAGLRELADACDRALLTILVDEDLAWAWLGGGRPPRRGWEREAERVAGERGLRLCFGDPAEGPDGFRRSHRQAMRAQGVARPDRPREVVHYDRVALEALAASDESEARAFVARELGELDEDTRRAGRLRDTLKAYFATGQNATAAASALGVHEQTVGARLRAVEDRTGRAVAVRRAELETALRLREYLG